MLKRPQKTGFNLFNLAGFGSLIKNKKILYCLRLGGLFVFLGAILYGLMMPDPEHNQVTEGIFWGLFWPFIILLSLTTVGASFCAVCPLGFIGHYLTKMGRDKKMPVLLQSPWLGLGLLIIGFWLPFYAFNNPFTSPRLSALFFALLFIIACVVFFSYRRMAFCQSICPIGAIIRAFSKMGLVWLNTDQKACDSCRSFDCAKACNYHLQPFNFDKYNNMNACTLCMDCAQSCSSVQLITVKPSNALFDKIARKDSMDVWVYLIMLAVITVAMRFQYHLISYSEYLPWFIVKHYLAPLMLDVLVSSLSAFTLLICSIGVTVSISLSGYYLAAKVLKIGFQDVFSELAYALAPLMLISSLSFIGHNFSSELYPMIINAFLQLFQLPFEQLKADNTSAGLWFNHYQIFNWLAMLWAYFLTYQRMKLLSASIFAKCLAYPFASAIISALALLNVVTG